MPNVLLTQRCVRSCPYCFAKEQMSSSQSESLLPWEDLIYLADLILSSHERHISLLGGEPTLHPDFVDYVIYLLERGLSITVFTSGIMSKRKLEHMVSAFGGIEREKLTFVCNLNDPELSPPSEIEKTRLFLEEFGSNTVPGFNIYRPDFDLEFLFQYINRFGLARMIRLGLTHPIPGAQNRYISIDEIGAVANRLLSYSPLFERFRISPNLDCGFPMCALTDEQIGNIFRLTGGNVRFGCSPAFDIGPDMSVWCCFPLSNYHMKSVYEFDSIKEIVRFYEEKLERIRVEIGGIYEACDNCIYREEKKCAGGCVAHGLSAFRDEEKVRFTEVYS